MTIIVNQNSFQNTSDYHNPHNSLFKIAHSLTIEELVKSPTEIKSTKNVLKSSRSCKECNNSTNWINDDSTGDIICGECGLVIEEKTINNGKEWRSYDMNMEKLRSRVGPKHNPYMLDGGLSTTIDMSCKDSRGQSLSPSGRLLQKRLKKTHDRYHTSGNPDRNFSDAMIQLSVIVQNFNLSDRVKEEVTFRYRKIVKNQLLKGRTIKSILLALIYIVRAEIGYPLTVSEVCYKGNISETELTSYRKKIYNVLKIKPIPLTAKNYLYSIHNSLHLDQGTVLNFSKVIYNYIININPFIIQGKDPAGVAAGIYYLSCFILKYDCTQHQIRESLHVTDVTIRNRYKEISNSIFKSNFSVLTHLKSIINKSKMKNKDIRDFVNSLLYTSQLK